MAETKQETRKLIINKSIQECTNEELETMNLLITNEMKKRGTW